MHFNPFRAWAASGATTLFVLLWSSGAIAARLGLEHASPMAFLLLRFGIALAVLLGLGMARRRWLLPPPGTRRRVAFAGVLLVGCYSIAYLLALHHGMTPGMLAAVLGVQPILTLLLVERRASPARWAGLGLALGGLALVVEHGMAQARFSWTGMACAGAALLCTTSGAIVQKGLRQAPLDVLPLQYGVSLLLCGLIAPWQPLQVQWSASLLGPLLWMGVVISVAAQLLLYRLIQAGNLVNVTSIFYLVPGATAALDWAILGNPMSAGAMIGTAAVALGLAWVLRPASQR